MQPYVEYDFFFFFWYSNMCNMIIESQGHHGLLFAFKFSFIYLVENHVMPNKKKQSILKGHHKFK